jgi:cytoskeletal protein CcmA (bactofilin family)
VAFQDAEKGYVSEGEVRTLLTIIGDKAKIDGKFKISKSIEIDCEIKGQLDVNGQLIIQKNGFVSADVKTIDAEIIGKYEGNMSASGNVEIKETGIVSGNIKTDCLIINKGGIFSGNVTGITEGGAVSIKKKGKSALEEKTAKDSPFEEAEDDYKIDYGQSVDQPADQFSDQTADNNDDDDSKLTL